MLGKNRRPHFLLFLGIRFGRAAEGRSAASRHTPLPKHSSEQQCSSSQQRLSATRIAEGCLTAIYESSFTLRLRLCIRLLMNSNMRSRCDRLTAAEASNSMVVLLSRGRSHPAPSYMYTRPKSREAGSRSLLKSYAETSPFGSHSASRHMSGMVGKV